ncbi:MAG: hypothetical protein Q7U18_13245 [Methylobacter sp.]|nr:hypothetical protein [Methylobacter sp.]
MKNKFSYYIAIILIYAVFYFKMQFRLNSAVYQRLFLLAGLTLHPTLSNATEAGGSNYLPGFYGDFGMAVLPDQNLLQ